MTSKSLWVGIWCVFVIFCLSVIASYQVGKSTGENSAKIRLREEELSFQKQKERTRKEEKRAEEKRRRVEKAEEREKEVMKSLQDSSDRKAALQMKLIERLMQTNQYSPPPKKPIHPFPLSSTNSPTTTLQRKPRTANKEKSEGSTDGGQYKLFETTTIDGWVKKIKRGTIFKTSSGNIYEVAKAVILLEMELRPKVTVLTDGQFYKLLIQGVNEELLCKKLNSGNKGDITGGTVIEARIINDFDGLEYGNIYKLDNGQVWEQTYFYIYIYIAVMPKVTIWQDGSVYKMKVDGIDEVVTVKQIN